MMIFLLKSKILLLILFVLLFYYLKKMMKKLAFLFSQCIIYMTITNGLTLSHS